MQYTLDITVQLKKGILDPEAAAIKKSLEHIGFQPQKVELAKKFQIALEASSEEEARRLGEQMCEQLLANPIIHNYTLVVRR
jgi:phosphoribosylformylglycinamidine synthase